MKVEKGVKTLRKGVTWILGLVLLYKGLHWLEHAAWPKNTIGEGLRLSAPETSWAGYNAIGTFIIEADILWFWFAIWVVLMLLSVLLDGTDQYDVEQSPEEPQ